MANDVSKLPALWRERAQKHQDEADAADCNQERDWWLGRHQSMEDCAEQLEAALAQQAGAECVFLGYVSRHWHNDRAKDSQVSVTATPDASHSVSVYVASSAPGGGGEGS